jgi:hypothetical protein
MVQYPKMREKLLETLRCLADKEYQHQDWLERKYYSGDSRSIGQLSSITLRLAFKR